MGTDIQPVAEVEEALARFGERYARRLYTDHEIASCGGVNRQAAPGLSARFAAKEATIKLLRSTDVVPGWREIEVRRQPGGWCSVVLGGGAARLAERCGVQQLSLSMSHAGGLATATVVSLCAPQGTSTPDPIEE